MENIIYGNQGNNSFLDESKLSQKTKCSGERDYKE